MGDAAGNRRAEGWTNALVIVSIMAGGVIVAGLLDRGSGTSEGPGSDQQVAADATSSYVTPEVEYPVEIPGCATVEAPSESRYIGVSVVGEQSYDNPRYPWFSAVKASAMTAAVLDALPDEVEVRFASPAETLLFEPIPEYDRSDPAVADLDLGGATSARGTLLRGPDVGTLSVSVSQSHAPIPPCVAGQLDSRTTSADGTVLDAQDTWSEYDGKRTLSRRVSGYLPDGTRVDASASDEDSSAADLSTRYGGTVPLTIDELVAIVLRPELRVSTPVPAGTLPPPPSCGFGSDTDDAAPAVSRSDVERLNRVLDDLWRGQAFVSSRPLGSLQLADYSDTSLCEQIDITTPGSTGTLHISISGGHVVPPLQDKYDPSYDPDIADATRLPDGSVVQRRDATRLPVALDGSGAGENVHEVTVTRPSGTQVTIRSESVLPQAPLPFEVLEFIATASGLEL
ncbi:hypothetical protein [Rhodococcus tibetensis]|uniref:Uncharacterized protein n=1 Tax=Rhodococcus tibetensis TaxID=2965064 RepID=A0ABT1QJM5_9NOCA|nr:hypothetical protein [Rhodococcus sp. FXJ9.536]MCQ4121995.1 hypothetical protein [Rhodococcus sp. FXJ9.536]